MFVSFKKSIHLFLQNVMKVALPQVHLLWRGTRGVLLRDALAAPRPAEPRRGHRAPHGVERPPRLLRFREGEIENSKFTKLGLLAKFCNLWRARSRLYRNRCLQVVWTASLN